MTGFKVQNGRAIIADIDGIPQISTCMKVGVPRKLKIMLLLSFVKKAMKK